jgi:hypothetical protein
VPITNTSDGPYWSGFRNSLLAYYEKSEQQVKHIFARYPIPVQSARTDGSGNCICIVYTKTEPCTFNQRAIQHRYRRTLQSPASRDFEMNIESVATEFILNSTLLRSLDCADRSLWSDNDKFQIQLTILPVCLSCSAASEGVFLRAPFAKGNNRTRIIRLSAR